MTTDQMKGFLEAAKDLNFTVAAERLFITQPALSQQISAIEKELTTQLFIRSNNRVRLTPAGETFYNGIGKIYQDYLYLIEEVRDVTSGHLNIGLPGDQLLDEVIVNSINNFIVKYPDIHVDISKHDPYALYSGLSDGSLDLAIMLLYDETPIGMQALPIFSGPFFLAVSKRHPTAQLNNIDVNKIAEISETIPLIFASSENFPPPLRNYLDKHLNDITSEFGCKIRSHVVPSVSSLPLYVTAGLGVALVNRSNILSIDPNTKLIQVEGGDILTKGLMWKTDTANPLVRLIAQYIETELCRS
jgi:DNA-binding transcriptional LysR family regulator